MATAFLVRLLRRRDLASPSQLAYKSFVGHSKSSHDSAHSAAHLSRLFCSQAVIGIDLGASNSRVALMGKNAIVIDSATPSVVAFNQKGETLVGFQAKRQVVNSVFGTKRLIGRCFDDEQVQKQIMKMVPYKVVRAPNGDAWVEVNGKQYSPSLIGAFVLSKMKKTAEDYLGKQVSKAVITVPAYFNDAQRQATEDAGRIAGLHVQRILSEPAAAALSYGIGSYSKDKGLVAVFNLGGTTFDISILEIANGVTEVKATNSDTFLGGEDFDNILLEYLVSEYRKTDGIDLTKDTRALQRLRQAAEKAKVQLSSTTETEINLPFITADASGAKHFYITLTRSKFESLVNPLIESTKQACKNCLKDAGLTTKQVDEVLLVGGMTHVPKVQEAVEEIFGKSPSKGVNPDEAVVLGAAIQGGVLQDDMKELRFVDVKEHYRTLQGAFTGLFNNNTINSAKNRLFSSVAYNKAQVGVEDLQGEQGGILQGAMKELRFVDVKEHYKTLQGAFTGLLNSNTINSAKNRLFSSVTDNKAQVGDKDLQGEQGGSRPGGSEGDQAQETKSEMKESDMQDWLDLLRLMIICYLVSR